MYQEKKSSSADTMTPLKEAGEKKQTVSPLYLFYFLGNPWESSWYSPRGRAGLPQSSQGLRH